MPLIKELPHHARMRVERERRARWAAEAAARAKEEAEAAASTELPAGPQRGMALWHQSRRELADANVQGEEENALVMTSREIKEMRRAEKAIRKEGKRREKREKKEKEKEKKRLKRKRKRLQAAGGSRYVPRSYLS